MIQVYFNSNNSRVITQYCADCKTTSEGKSVTVIPATADNNKYDDRV